MSDCKSCEEHNGLMEHIGSIKGQVSVMLKLMFVLVAGMAYAITQNHSADLQLVSVDQRLAVTEKILIDSKKMHDTALATLEDNVDSLTAFCCGEVDAYK